MILNIDKEDPSTHRVTSMEKNYFDRIASTHRLDVSSLQKVSCPVLSVWCMVCLIQFISEKKSF